MSGNQPLMHLFLLSTKELQSLPYPEGKNEIPLFREAYLHDHRPSAMLFLKFMASFQVTVNIIAVALATKPDNPNSCRNGESSVECKLTLLW